MSIKVFYHKNCMDGYASAYAAWIHFGHVATYNPIQYDDPIPDDIEGCDVYLLDFSFKYKDMLLLMKRAASVTVIDHHKTAQEELEPLFDRELMGIFDMNKSGAVLTWEYFNKTFPVPKLLNVIQDRDLWQFKLGKPYTKAITAYLWSCGVDLSDQADFGELVDDFEVNPEEFIVLGGILEKQLRQQIESIKQNAIVLNGIPLVNCPHGIHSDVIGELAAGHEFAAGFYIMPDKLIVNLRSSKKSGTDVSAIAKANGGGGHHNAAGFTIDNTEINRPVHQFVRNRLSPDCSGS